MNNKLLELAQNNFKRFVATLYKLVIEEGIEYDSIIVGGNTGLVMARFTQKFYEHFEIEFPIVLKTTPQRYKPGTKQEDEKPENLFDNSILIHDLNNQIRDYKIKSIQNILFVDDEIYLGTTAQTCSNLISKIFPNKNLKVTIIAEDAGFNGFATLENVEIEFIPFSKEIDGMFNVIMSIIPESINLKLEAIFPEKEVSFHKRLNLLLNLPIRDKKDLLGGFNYALNYTAFEKISDFGSFQKQFEIYLEELINAGIEEYKQGKINLEDYSYIDKYK